MANEEGKTGRSGWETAVSRTMPYPGSRVWEFLVGDGVEIWLGPGVELPRERGAGYETEHGTTGEIRSYADDRLRLTWRPTDWDHDSLLELEVADLGKRSTLKIRQEQLADVAEKAEQRAYWKQVVERVEAALAER
ncbi:SRPBCC domain-containing protein [Amycolatopsis sp. NPDC004079]|uniref:SRPBCC domain-containing protein n=1 Tax=Amycolatopsis sp. NPDC004079 TaxID=3154549 RepID=UPI0033ABE41E